MIRKLRWRTRALEDLNQIHTWLSTIDGAQPDRAILRLRSAALSLARLGDIGRPSRIEGVREFSVRDAPYVIAYKIEEESSTSSPSITHPHNAR